MWKTVPGSRYAAHDELQAAVGKADQYAAQAKLDKEMDARFDRLVDHVNREVGVAQNTPLADRVQSLDDWSHRFVDIFLKFLKLEQRVEGPWFRKGQALLKELCAT